MTNYVKIELDSIPNYSGNSCHLNDFITACEDKILEYNGVNEMQARNLLRLIIQKLQGDAYDLIKSNLVSTWLEIKNLLIQNFADKRNHTILQKELNGMFQQSNESPREFSRRITSNIVAYVNFVKINVEPEAQAILIQNYNSVALDCFISNIRQYGTIVRSFQPRTIKEALDIIDKEEMIRQCSNLSLNKNQNNKFVTPQNTHKFTPHQKPQFQNTFQRPMFNDNFQRKPQFQNNYQRPMFNNNNFHQKPQFQNNNNFVHKHQYQAPQNFNNNPNRWNNNRFPQPTPMSGISHQKSRNSHQFKPNGQQNFISEELFNTETNNNRYMQRNDNQNYNAHVPHDTSDTPENFRLSPNKGKTK